MRSKNRRNLLVVVGLALAARLLFLSLTANTYDFDEFVLLQLGREVASGITPYSAFHFFHPPGAIELYGALTLITDRWWPAARILQAIVDTGTAVLVYACAARLWNTRTAVWAGTIYALDPLALVSATRVGQDPIIAFLGMAAITTLLYTRDRRGAVYAGLAIGLALWFKYPALYFLPVGIVLAPRRAPILVVVTFITFAVLLIPFHQNLPAFYRDTVQFQSSRWHMPLTVRLETTIVFWLGIHLLAVVGLARTKAHPRWLALGFLLGGLFVFTSQVYYHYFVPVGPFAAILGAAIVDAMARRARVIAVATALAVVPAWGLWLAHGGPSPLYVTAAHLSDIGPTITTLDHVAKPGQAILADRFEYAYLARRPAVVSYFWNVGVLIGPQAVETMVPRARAVVLSYGASSNYPPGFTRYMNHHYRWIQTPANRIWLVGTVYRGVR